VRTTFQAVTDNKGGFDSLDRSFKVAFRGGAVMGFLLTSVGCIVLAMLV